MKALEWDGGAETAHILVGTVRHLAIVCPTPRAQIKPAQVGMRLNKGDRLYFTNLTIANPAGVTLAGDQTINTGLTFTQGSILTGPFTLHLTPAATYQISAPVQYTLSAKGDSGAITGRSGN